MSQNINIIQFLLEYSDTLLFLYLEQNKIKNEREFDNYIDALSENPLKCSNIYGKTRCYTTTKIINYIFGLDKSSKTLQCKNNNSILMHQVESNAATHDLILISITPDHIFYLLKTPSNEWFMISSWIYLYSFNIVKINFGEFMRDFLDIFCETKNMISRTNNQYFSEKYGIFLSKYFVYKTAIFHNSLYVSTDINLIRSILSDISSDFLSTDYYGYDGKHEIRMEFYDINYNEISNLKSSILSNFLKYSIKNYTKNIEKTNYKLYMKNSVASWLNENTKIYEKRKQLEKRTIMEFNEELSKFDDYLNALGQSILEIVDFSDKGNNISYGSLGSENILYAGKYASTSKMYVKNIIEKITGDKMNIDLYGGHYEDKLQKLIKNNDKTAIEFLFKYWKLLSNDSLLELLIDDRTPLKVMSFPDIFNIKKEIVTGDYENRIYEIEYSIDNIHKKSYILYQPIKYKDNDSGVFLFIDPTLDKLVIMDFSIELFPEMFNWKYVIVGNTFYRDIVVDLKFNKMTVYSKKINKNFFAHIEKSRDLYIYNSINIFPYQIEKDHLIDYYKIYVMKLLSEYDDINKFSKEYHKKIQLFGDMLSELFDGKSHTNLSDSLYIPFFDKLSELSGVKKHYLLINGIKL